MFLDPHREATESQILYFGQTPSQLLETPHPFRFDLLFIIFQQHSKE